MKNILIIISIFSISRTLSFLSLLSIISLLNKLILLSISNKTYYNYVFHRNINTNINNYKIINVFLKNLIKRQIIELL